MLQAGRLRVIDGALILFAAGLVLRAGWVQLWEGERWDRLAEAMHYAKASVAPRGEILDVAGVPLAQSEVRMRLNIVPANVKDRRRLLRDLQRLGVDAATRRRVADPKGKWVPIRRTFLPSEVAVVGAMPGVSVEPSSQRDYLPVDGLRPIVGRTSTEGAGLDGVELMLDSLLRGERGAAPALKGPNGRRYESLDALSRPPRPGHTVTLTISSAMQDICDRALADARARLDIAGGDIVVLEPTQGEIRCLSSYRPGRMGSGSPALVEPFEPGSTLKPFIAGRMVESGAARLDDVVETFHGTWQQCRRTVSDVHKADRMTLAQVIQYSSNIGIAQFTTRLAPRELYEILRDWGFGAMTGIAWTSEAAGILKRPPEWTCPTQASMSYGYEIGVTAVQLAAAYGAIANDGLLLVPTLIKSIADADGDLVYEHRPQVVRRVIEPKTARMLRDVLATVVDSGTATDAGLATFDLGGKSGTARRYLNGGYPLGHFTATFVGLFPARDPQYVVLVKLDDPQGTYYGGKTAAPVAKAIIEATLAARDASLDRGGLATQRARYVPPPDDAPRARRVAAGRLPADDSGTDRESRYALVDSAPLPPAIRVRFDLRDSVSHVADAPAAVEVPDVRGMPERVAARTLHRAGLRVSFVTGVPFEVSPAPGALVKAGALVRVARR